MTDLVKYQMKPFMTILIDNIIKSRINDDKEVIINFVRGFLIDLGFPVKKVNSAIGDFREMLSERKLFPPTDVYIDEEKARDILEGLRVSTVSDSTEGADAIEADALEGIHIPMKHGTKSTRERGVKEPSIVPGSRSVESKDASIDDELKSLEHDYSGHGEFFVGKVDDENDIKRMLNDSRTKTVCLFVHDVDRPIEKEALDEIAHYLHKKYVFYAVTQQNLEGLVDGYLLEKMKKEGVADKINGTTPLAFVIFSGRFQWGDSITSFRRILTDSEGEIEI